MISLKCNIDPAVQQVRTLQEEQLPFIIAKSLTTVAQVAQKEERILEGQVFRLRNDWTQKNTKVKAATKQTLIAEVYTDTGNRKTGAPDYLERQEDGGERVPVNGHRYLCIPTKYLWKYTPQNRPLPDNLRPSSLLPPGAKIGDQFNGIFARGSRASGTKRLIGRDTMKKLGNGEFIAFVQRTKSGTLCIFVRHGGVAFKGSQNAEPWYTLVREAHIKPRLGLENTVKQVVARDFEEIFVTVAGEVGVQVRL